MTKLDAQSRANPSGARPKLIVVAFNLPDQSSHYFNELLGYQTAAQALGIVPAILVPRTADPNLVALLSASAVLDPKPALAGLGAMTHAAVAFGSFTDATESLHSVLANIEAQDPCCEDAILFPEESPILIRAIGLWLAGRSSDQRPSIFFRFVGSLVDPELSKPTLHTFLYRLASNDLGTRSGNERVFFLVNNPAMARTVSRVCCRRTFLMPMPKFLGEMPESRAPVPVKGPVVYVHLNARSGRLAKDLDAILRCVLAFDPTVKFLVKFTLDCARDGPAPGSDIASTVEVLPAEQDTASYLANFSRCCLVLLAYEAAAYAMTTSGVLSEAVSFGIPAVVPAATTMAMQLAAGHGAGTVFAAAEPKAVAAAVIEALQSATQLGAAARDFARRTGMENSCLRYVERMIELAGGGADAEPRYQLGEEVDFGNFLDSRCFMGAGWGDTEAWGVWTIGPRARLRLRLDAAAGSGRLLLSMLVRPLLTPTHRRNRVRVAVAGQDIADWVFDAADAAGNAPRWCEAWLPVRAGDEQGHLFEISFAIEAPMSLHALGISNDDRAVGLGVCKLRLSAQP